MLNRIFSFFGWVVCFALLSGLANAYESVTFNPNSQKQVLVEGRGFTERTTSQGYPLRVTILKNGQSLHALTLSSDGSFSDTVSEGEAQTGDVLSARVSMYPTDGSDYTSQGFSFPDFQPPVQYNSQAGISVFLEQGVLQVEGRNFTSNVKPSFEAEIFVEGQRVDSVSISSGGSFSYRGNSSAKARQTVTVRVQDYKGPQQDIEVSESIPYWYNQSASLEFGSVSNGQITIVGRNFENNLSRSVQINIYVDSKFIQDINTNENGSFSYTLPAHTLNGGETVKVSALEYLGQGNHYVQTGEIPQFYDANANVNFGNFEDGQLTLVGRNISRIDTDSLVARINVSGPYGPFTLENVKTNSNGSFSYTSPKGQIVCGSVVSVEVENYFGQGRSFTAQTQLPQAGYGCWNWYTSEEVRNAARTQAEHVFNRLAQTYGQRERYRVSFVLGFWQAYSQSHLDQYVYSTGLKEGRNYAQNNGIQAGVNESQAKAASLAAADLLGRYRKMVQDHAVAPDLEVRTPPADFSSINGSNPHMLELGAILRNIYANNQSQLDVSWNDSGMTLKLSDHGPWNLETVFQYGNQGGYRYDFGWADGGFAFDGWANDRFGDSFDHGFFNNLSPNQRDEFRSRFSESLAQLVSNASSQLQADSYSATQSGSLFGKLVGEQESHDRGVSDGYATGFQEAARISAEKAFKNDYLREFNIGVGYFSVAVGDGRQAATSAVATYGQREIFIRDLTAGFRESFAASKVEEASNPFYTQGLQAGEAEARTVGDAKGLEVAQAKVKTMVGDDVRKRFVNAVEAGSKTPDLEPQTPQLQYDGDVINHSTVDIEPRLNSLQSEFGGEMSSFPAFENNGLTLKVSDRGDLNLKNLYNQAHPQEYEMSRDFMTGSFAVSRWSEKGLGVLHYDIYNSLSASHRNTYLSIVSSEYESKAKEQFASENKIPKASERGQYFGAAVGGSYAKILGQNSGFNAHYTKASQDGFQSALPHAYADAFSNEARFYRENPVIVIEKVKLTDGSNDQVFEKEENVGVVITKIVNLGMVPSREIGYEMKGDSLESIKGSQSSFRLEGLSKKDNFELKDLAKIKKRVNEKKTQAVRFTLDGKAFDLQYRIGWLALVQDYSLAAPNDPELKSMKESVLSVLALDWKVYWTDRGWGFFDGSSKLGEFVKFYERLRKDSKTAGQAQQLAALYTEIVNLPPAEVPSSLSGEKKAFLKMAKRLTK